MKTISLSNKIIKSFSQSAASQLIKKFYTEASIHYNPHPEFEQHQYEIQLNKMGVKTSKRNPLKVGTQELGFLIQMEFMSQQEYIKTATMPLYILAKTAVDIDYNPQQRHNLLASVMALVDTDTAVYRDHPTTQLAKLQQHKLNPVLQYVNHQYSLQLQENFGLTANNLKPEQLQKLQNKLDAFDNWQLLSFEQLASVYKSTALALAVVDKQISHEDAFWRSRIEETYQAQKFGYVEGSHDMDEAYLQFVSASAYLFHTTLKQ